MCTYCYIADQFFKYDPPWPVNPYEPLIPQPANPHGNHPPWTVEKLTAYLEMLKQVKALEDQIGCPCDPNKADYIKLFSDRIAELTAVLKTNPLCKCKTCMCDTPLKRARWRKR